jgi:hypothetical protein
LPDEVCVNFGHHQLEMAVRISAGAGVCNKTVRDGDNNSVQ